MTNADTARTWDMRVPLEMLAVFVVSMSALGLLLARRGVFDAPPVWILSLLAAGAYGHAARRWQVARYPVPAWHYGLMLAVGLLFRLTPDAYVLGGQDQGVYVNMAMHLAATGNLVPVDHVLERLSDPSAVAQYRAGNYAPMSYLPGVYAPPEGLVFQFYHLFPVWLALFGDAGGPATAVYALTFLSLVSLLFFHRLAYLLTDNRSAALAAGLLLAANPLHAFFSRFPVTEVPTLAFSTMSFALLLDAWRKPEERFGWRLPLLSVAALGCLFATRITGFLYMPIIAAIGLLAAFDPNPLRRRRIMLWGVAALLAYAASVYYGLRWSRPYASDIYAMSFGQHFGRRVTSLLGIGICLTMAAWMIATTLGRKPERRERVAGFLQAMGRSLPLVATATVLFGLVFAWRLGWTDAYASDAAATHFNLSHQGWRSAFSSSMLVGCVYLSPFVLAAFLVSGFSERRPMPLLLLLAATWFLFVAVVLQPIVPYQPYYARYLASEMVPYVLLSAVCGASYRTGRIRALVTVLLWLGGVYMTGLSLAQIGKSEHEGVADSLSHLVQHFDRGDLVLVDRSMSGPSAAELKTELAFIEQLNVAMIAPDQLSHDDYLAQLDSSFDDLYLLTTSPVTPAGFTAIDSVHFVEKAFEHGAAPPVATWVREESNIRVLRYGTSGETRYLAFGHGGAGKELLGAGWYPPEQWGVWSNGIEASLVIPVGPKTHALTIEGRVYVTPKHPRQALHVRLEDGEGKSVVVTFPQTRIRFQVPVAVGAAREVKVQLSLPDAVSPQGLGYSQDPRVLALGLETLSLDDGPGP